MKIRLGTADRVGGIALLVLALGALWESRAYPLGALQKPGAALMPVLLAVLLGGLAILIVAFGGASPPLRSLRWTEARRAAVILAACVFAALALEPLGYRITMAFVLAFLVGAVERNRWSVVLSVALGFSLGSYWIFTRLGVVLPQGILGF